jgi:hypothetical protein
MQPNITVDLETIKDDKADVNKKRNGSLIWKEKKKYI